MKKINNANPTIFQIPLPIPIVLVNLDAESLRLLAITVKESFNWFNKESSLTACWFISSLMPLKVANFVANVFNLWSFCKEEKI